MRLARHAAMLASLFALTIAPVARAQTGTLIIHAVKGDSEYFVNTAYVRFVDDANQVAYEESINPAVFNVDPHFSYSVALVVAGDLSDKGCTLTNTGDSQSISVNAGDTVSVRINVENKFCGARIHALGTGDGATGTAHFHADASVGFEFAADGRPRYASRGPLDIDCTLTADDSDCSQYPAQAATFGTHYTATFSPGPHTAVEGVPPIGSSIDDPKVGQVVTFSGGATRLLDFDHIRFARVFTADAQITRTAINVQDTVVIATFQVHNAGPDSTGGYVTPAGTSVVRAGAGHVSKVEITSEAGSCVVDGDTCAGFFALPAGASGTLTIKTTTARLDDASSAAVGANSCGHVTLVTGADDETASNNTASCTDGAEVPVSVAITNGSNPPSSQTVAAGSTAVPVLQFTLDPTASTTLDAITLSASGSGADNVDITAVKLYVDANGNGIVDTNETPIATGSFSSNNGTVTLSVSPPYSIGAQTSFVVTYDFNSTLSARYTTAIALLALLPFGLGGTRRRRLAALAILLLVTVMTASCSGDSETPSGPNGSKATFTTTLRGITTAGNAVTTSIDGATITINR